MRAWLLILGFLLYIAVGSVSAESPDPTPIPFKTYLEQVLKYYPLLKREYHQVEKAMAQKALAASERMPKLWASAKWEHGDDPVYVFGALLRQDRFSNGDFALGRLNTPSPITDHSVSVDGEWLLFDFYQTSSRIKSAGLLADSAEFQAELTRMEAILAASEIYSRLALVQDFLRVVNETVTQGQNDIVQAQQWQSQGLVAGLDFYSSRLLKNQLTQLQNELVAQEAALTMAFNIFRGQDPTLSVQVKMDFFKLATIDSPVTYWVDQAMQSRPDIKALAKMIDAQDVEVHREKKSLLPKISAFGQADAHRNKLSKDGGENYLVGLKGTVDLFDAGQGARVKVAKAEAHRLVADWQSMKDQAAKDTAEVYYQLQGLEHNELLAQQIKDDASELVKFSQPLYLSGQQSLNQLMSTRAGWVRAYEDWLRLVIVKRQSLLKLKFYAGQLTVEQAEGVYGKP